MLALYGSLLEQEQNIHNKPLCHTHVIWSIFQQVPTIFTLLPAISPVLESYAGIYYDFLFVWDGDKHRMVLVSLATGACNFYMIKNQSGHVFFIPLCCIQLSVEIHVTLQEKTDRS